MSAVVRALLAVAALVLLSLVAASWYVPRPVFDESLASVPANAFEVLPVTDALTFARTRDGRLLLVTQADEAQVVAVNLTQAYGSDTVDPLAAYQSRGHRALAKAAAGAQVTLPMGDLGLPFDAMPQPIAAGTNYRAHAEEVGLEEGPFLFPKLTQATSWDAVVPLRTRLDYEVELCAVAMVPLSTDGPAPLGFVLCNDFTDRWALLREIDLDAEMGRTGFADAKGGPGMLPIGPFLVVPKDPEGFYRRVEIGLAVNDKLRQRDVAQRMIWSPSEIARRALADCQGGYRSLSGQHSLTPCDAIPAGTLLLTGTPAGVLFHPLNVWRPGAYLITGDVVTAYGAHLGMLRNHVR